MTTDASQPELVRGLIGAELSVVTFVRSYVQFSFEDAHGTHVLSAYNNPIVSDGSDAIRRGDPAWESALVAQINKTVSRAAVDETTIRIAFDDVTVSIEIQGGYVEAAMLTLASGAWDVWRPGDIPAR